MGTQLKMTSDLDCGGEGIKYLRHSSDLMQRSHRERPRSFRNLAHLHEIQFQILKSKGSQSQTQALAELDEAIQYGKEILDSIPEGDPEFGEHCKNLAVMLASKDEELDDPETYRLAKKYLILAAAAENAPPLVRIAAGIQAGLYRWFDKAYLEAHQHLQAAVGILPRLNPQEMSRDDLQLALREISGLASTATAIGLAPGRPGAEVLQSLDAAHGVISGLFMNSKSDFSKLMERDANLARKYEHIGRRVAVAKPAFTVEVADEMHVRADTQLPHQRLQVLACRTLAGDHQHRIRARLPQRDEGMQQEFDVLLVRHAPHVQQQRPIGGDSKAGTKTRAIARQIAVGR